jgi:tetratricopeptide (TPR) repeat protein
MKRMGLFLAAWLLLSAGVHAADTIYLVGEKNKLTGVIVAESPAGVQLRGQKQIIPAETIQDIEYDIEPVEVRISVYRKALNAEQAWRQATRDSDRLKQLELALTSYRATLEKIKTERPFPRIHLTYKIAFLQAEHADLTGRAEELAAALEALQEFQKKYPNSWQIVRALKLLARLQLISGAYADAEKTYQTLAQLAVDTNLQQEAQLLAAQVWLRAGKYADALPKLETLLSRLPPQSPLGQRTRLSIAECRAAQKDLKTARQVAQDILRQAKEPEVRAAAHNLLGYCAWQAGNAKEALWHFLWVDLMYPNDAAEHARALYYLHQVFNRLNDPDRAQGYLQALLQNPRFAGMLYQHKARDEARRQTSN